MINPATQHFMAERMGARIRSEKVDHTPLISAPEPVIEIILEASRSRDGGRNGSELEKSSYSKRSSAND